MKRKQLQTEILTAGELSADGW